MCNCGKKRNEFVSQQAFKPGNTKSIEQARRKISGDVAFEYIGNTGLTVIGSVTGKRYRYSKKGDVLLIDYPDSLALGQVHLLKRMQ